MSSAEKEKAVREMIVRNYEKYYRIAYSYVFQEADALDIIQESAYKAIYKSDTLQKIEFVDTWICKIVMNEALRLLRARKREQIGLDNLPEEGEEDKVTDVDLHAALDRLSEEERAIVVLRYFEEQKISDIAQMMQLKENTVKSKLYRAIEKLKGMLVLSADDMSLRTPFA